MNLNGVIVSAGSACSSGEEKPSRILKAIGAKCIINPEYEYGKKFANKIIFKSLFLDNIKLRARKRTAIHVAGFVLERPALGDGDMFFIVTKRVVACLDEVGAVRPAKGDVSVITADAVVASGSDCAAAYRDSFIAVDAVTVFACGRDRAAAYRDFFITVDAVA